ncbi:hypothetical protein BDM02DRAFT_3129322 [Thelephora ganbajun]|uniref:Uncharacterized protein n=1 Tax=Thelephora ganbajun TaxID=370292 RepID=A0ACB6ZEJ3_THEGA|nr:hypothetical protein BDM02DRAFT_3129322 [Thelephora ganbajun]
MYEVLTTFKHPLSANKETPSQTTPSKGSREREFQSVAVCNDWVHEFNSDPLDVSGWKNQIGWRDGSKIYEGLRTGVDEPLVVVLAFLEAYLPESEWEFTKDVKNGYRNPVAWGRLREPDLFFSPRRVPSRIGPPDWARVREERERSPVTFSLRQVRVVAKATKVLPKPVLGKHGRVLPCAKVKLPANGDGKRGFVLE